MKTQFYIAILGGAISAALSYIAPLTPILGIFFGLLCLTPLYLSFLTHGKEAGYISTISYATLNILLLNATAAEHINTVTHTFIAITLMESLHRFPGIRYAIQRVINYTLLVSPILLSALILFNINLTAILNTAVEPILNSSQIQIGDNIQELLQCIPGFAMTFMILIHILNVKAAQSLITRRQWQPQYHLLVGNNDQQHNLYYDIVAAAGLWLITLNNIITIPDNLVVMGRIFMILSLLPLFMLGFRVIQIIFKRNNWPPHLLIIGLILGILLVQPLLIVVLFGFMESCYNISQRLLKEKS